MMFVVSGITMNGYAVTPQSLSDSLYAYSLQYQHLDPIRVSNIRQKGKQITVYANPSLSMLVLSEQQLLDLRRRVSVWVRGDEKGEVRLISDGKELGELIPSRLKKRDKKDLYHLRHDVQPLVEKLSLPYSTDKGLKGRHIALWASHGLYYNQDEQRWRFQRARLWTTVEDFYTSSYTMPFLVPMLENAGAVVLQPRERDTQTEEIIVTLDSLGSNKGRAVLPVKKDGEYAVYVRYTHSMQNTDNAVYSITHSGQTTHVRVNQQMGGGMWVYVGTWHFSGSKNEVELTKDGDGTLCIGDIRLGGGMGSIERGGETSGYPRWAEGARYWLEYNGVPDSVYSPTEGENDYLDDLGSRGRWVNYIAGGGETLPGKDGLHIPIDMSVAIHSDAGVTQDTSKIGTLVIYSEKDDDRHKTYPAGGNRVISRDLADWIQTQIVNDVRQSMTTDWTRRGLKQASYSEARLPKVPCALVEMLSHQNYADMRWGLDPKFKFVVSRAIYKGILHFLHEQDGTPYVVQPLPVSEFAAEKKDANHISLHWQARTDSIEKTAIATYFVVYTRKDGEDWDNGKRVKAENEKGSINIEVKQGVHYDFRVCAGNAGGISMPSETLSACLQNDKNARTAVIINGFNEVSAPVMMAADSVMGGIIAGSYATSYGKDMSYIGAQNDFNRQHEWVNDDDCGFGMCGMEQARSLTMGNTYDSPVRYGKALKDKGYSYVSRSIEAMSVNENYDIIIVSMGKQKCSSPYWHTGLQELLQKHLNSGGKVLINGAYIGSGLKDKQDKIFAEKTLHYKPYSTRSTTEGKVMLLSTDSIPRYTDEYSFAVSPNDSIMMCEAADGITPTDSSQPIARYDDTGICAGVLHKKQVLILPFVLESAHNFEKIFYRCLQMLDAE